MERQRERGDDTKRWRETKRERQTEVQTERDIEKKIPREGEKNGGRSTECETQRVGETQKDKKRRKTNRDRQRQENIDRCTDITIICQNRSLLVSSDVIFKQITHTHKYMYVRMYACMFYVLNHSPTNLL